MPQADSCVIERSKLLIYLLKNKIDFVDSFVLVQIKKLSWFRARQTSLVIGIISLDIVVPACSFRPKFSTTSIVSKIHMALAVYR